MKIDGRSIRSALTAGLVLGILLGPFALVNDGLAAARIVDPICATCASEAVRYNDSGAGVPFVASAVRYNDSGVGDFLATRSAAGILADAARYQALAEFYAGMDMASDIRYNDSGAGAPFVASDIRYNDSGVGAFFATGAVVSVSTSVIP